MTEAYNKNEKIIKITLPDDDMVGWIKVLREGNFSQEEIDLILSHLNETYKIENNPVEKELKRIKKDLREKHGRVLTSEQEEYMRKSIEGRKKQT